MDIVWLLVVGLLLAGWFALDGFSIGAGMVMGALRDDPPARRRVIAAIGPFFLANEVWLIAFAGTLAVAFPDTEARLFTSLYPTLVLLIAAWLARDMGMWFRSRRPGRRWRTRWEAVMAGASVVFAGAAGLFLGNAVQGPAGSGVWVLNPYGLLGMLAVVAVFLLHGAAFLVARTHGELRERARHVAGRVVLPVVVLMVAFIGTAPLVADDITPIAFVLGTVAPIAAGVAWYALRKGKDALTFAATTVATVAVPFTAGALMAGRILAEAAEPSTLQRITIVLLPALPVLIAGQVILWWIHRHRLSDRSVTFF
ncbi:cytochrome d ubiquinol oxidase subunit II [Nonomuraea jiangxiensis]|uniref:Cytochrome d ubiquinol oxidase subunit II n=1 Tax=Nonomuraea jiangxiensis TaxID=633440 RepID=A0A1G9PUW6_9ACTN|nr:cytochrome d ubiquinol oxidase subunit II [Nonomuraea jiangxiensis]SDM02453.1 cytochrome d ubiquinol oxidase subunit II [Nonomuraea jiangxiensis]